MNFFFPNREQKLSNLVHEKKWVKALGLAVTLDKPFMAYTIIEGTLSLFNHLFHYNL